MADAAVAGYAEALLAVAAAEGDLSAVEDELFSVAQAFRSNDELRDFLKDSDDADLRDAVGENIVVIARKRAALQTLVDRRARLGAPAASAVPPPAPPPPPPAAAVAAVEPAVAAMAVDDDAAPPAADGGVYL